MFSYNDIEIHWLGHDSFWIKHEGMNIYIDPFKVQKKNLPKADIIISTHEHFDHCSIEDISKLSGPDTVLVGSRPTQEKLKGEVSAKKEVLELLPGGSISVSGITISAIPAYNTHRFREPGQPFHPKESQHIGPILDINGTTIYHAGDTDKIDEMSGLKPDIALLPVSGTYVMDVPEAVEAAKVIDAKVTIPMHIGRGIGELDYGAKFKAELSDMRVEFLDLEED